MKQPVFHGQIGRRLHDRPDQNRNESTACSQSFDNQTNNTAGSATSADHATQADWTSSEADHDEANPVGMMGDAADGDPAAGTDNCPAPKLRNHPPHGTAPRQQNNDTAPEAMAVSPKDALRSAVGDQNYNHWFDNVRTECNGDTLQIFVANPFTASWMLKRFRSSFSRAASDVLGPSGGFELLVDETLKQAETRSASKNERPNSSRSSSADQHADHTDRSNTGSHPKSGNAPARSGSNAVSDASGSALATDQRQSRTDAVTNTSGGPQPLAVRRSQRRRFRRFNGIVTGACNQMAVMASQVVAQQPGENYNPLYLYGNTGVGKTHLLEAIYSETRRLNPELKVVFISSEAFTNYFTQALESKTVPSFRHRFRDVDVLLVDNIEFLNNKKKATEEEFLHTIVQVIEHGGQLVVTGDRHPRLLNRQREELTTRFMGGLVCRIEAPSDEVRRKVATTLALPRKECFTQEALDYVARRFRKSVREIQGAINGLHGHYTLHQQRITIARAREILGDLEDECRRLVRINDVEKVVCEAFGLTVTDLRSKSRRKAVACPRSLAMYVARKLTKSAYREIGSYFGGRDHSTVVAAEKRVKAWIKNDAPLDLPSACHGKTIGEVVLEIEQRLLSLAS